MGRIFLTGVQIKKVRHLKDIRIPLSSEAPKHLILTGKNGSGKTSVLDALEKHFSYVISGDYCSEAECESLIGHFKTKINQAENTGMDVVSLKKSLEHWEGQIEHWVNGAVGLYDYNGLREKYESGEFILAYYKADRRTNVEISDIIQKIALKDHYSISETPGKQLIKYMVSMKATGAMAVQSGKTERAREIEEWFGRFEDILKKIFDDETLKLQFDIENFAFSIELDGHEPFSFNEMSSGYSAVFDIINDLIMRSEKKGRNMEGIVLIDEIETHLHLELQKIILPVLTGLFPEIQFVVSTHSPFILSSLKNAVIYDLENGTLVENGLNEFPYEGIVEGYFRADRLSAEFTEMFKKYKELV